MFVDFQRFIPVFLALVSMDFLNSIMRFSFYSCCSFKYLHLPQKYLQPCMIKLHYFFGSIIVSGRWVLIRDVQKKSALIALTNTLPRSSEKWELLQAWPLELSRSWHTCAQSPGNHIEFVILLHIYTDELQVTKAGVASILRKRCSKCFLPCVTCW